MIDAYEHEIIRFTRNLRNRLIEKYRKGKAEHGGQPMTLDCQKEINLEVLDILNYHLIDRVNQRKYGFQ